MTKINKIVNILCYDVINNKFLVKQVFKGSLRPRLTCSTKGLLSSRNLDTSTTPFKFYYCLKDNMKECAECCTLKSLIDFSPSKTAKDGRYSYCRKCGILQSIKYQRTKLGLITKIYARQKASSKQRNHNPPTYTKDELKDWFSKQEIFPKFYTEWVESGYLKGLIPSIDRKNDYIGYTLKNIQLMTWEENEAKQHFNTKHGINNKYNKSVVQYSKDNILLNTFHSSSEAYRITNISDSHIRSCCKENRLTAGGYVWRYANIE